MFKNLLGGKSSSSQPDLESLITQFNTEKDQKILTGFAEKIVITISAEGFLKKHPAPLSKIDKTKFFLLLQKLTKSEPIERFIVNNAYLLLELIKSGVLLADIIDLNKIGEQAFFNVVKGDSTKTFVNDNFYFINNNEKLKKIIFTDLGCLQQVHDFKLKKIDIELILQTVFKCKENINSTEFLDGLLKHPKFPVNLVTDDKFLKKLEPNVLNNLAGKASEPEVGKLIVNAFISNDNMLAMLDKDKKILILKTFLMNNGGALPSNFFASKAFKMLDPFVMVRDVLLNNISSESMIEVIKNNDKFQLPLRYLNFLVTEVNHPKVNNVYVEYLQKQKKFDGKDLMNILMGERQPSLEVQEAIVKNPEALAAFSTKNIDTMLLRGNSKLREFIVQEPALSDKIQIRRFINLAVNNAEFAKYLCNDSDFNNGKQRIIERIKSSALSKELLALAINQPSIAHKIIDKQCLAKFSKEELSFLIKATNVDSGLKEQAREALSNAVSRITNKTTYHGKVVDVDLSQENIIYHVNKLYSNKTRDKVEPLLNNGQTSPKSNQIADGGVCAGLVNEWMRKISTGHSCDAFNNKLASLLKSTLLPDASFLHRVNNSYVMDNQVETVNARVKKNEFTIDKSSLSSIGSAKKNLANALDQLSQDGPCYIHLDTAGHTMGIVVKLNDKTGKPEVKFYDPNNRSGAVDYLDLSIEAASGLIIDYINAKYNDVSNSINVNLSEHPGGFYDNKTLFSLKSK